jgi:hypothetical protein
MTDHPESTLDRVRRACGPESWTCDELVEKAREHLNGVLRAERVGLQEAKRAGELLLIAKRRMAHGKWLPWLREQFPGSVDVAQEAMRIAENWGDIAAWLEAEPGLSKTAALKKLRGANNPPLPEGEFTARPISARATLERTAERSRTSLSQKAARLIGAWDDDVALIVGMVPSTLKCLWTQLECFGYDLQKICQVLRHIVNRIHRRDQGLPEFQIWDTHDMNPPVERHEQIYREELTHLTTLWPNGLDGFGAHLVWHFLQGPIAEDLLPFERELLEKFISDAQRWYESIAVEVLDEE